MERSPVLGEERFGVPRGYPGGFGVGPVERAALISLSTLRGTTPRTIHTLAWKEGSAAGCLAAVRAGRAGSDADRAWAERADPVAIESRLAQFGALFTTPHDQTYPREFDDLLHDPPAWLYMIGRPFEAGDMRVAVVGSRRCSALGAEIAHDIGLRVASAGLAIVSGAAAGIDAMAHRGALDANGRTVAVLGSGIDVAYPRSNAKLIADVARTGTVVSEYAPGIPAEPHRFPARNRLIAALALGLVVVEGAAGSGSKISVDHALDLGRDVFAVPGPVTSPLSEVPLAMIREGATLIRGADDLLADLGIRRGRAPSAPEGLPDDERRALDALDVLALPDAVARAAGMSIPEAVAVLISLELRGLVRSVGGRYERTLGAGPKAGEDRYA